MEFLRSFLRRPFAGKLEVASANVGSFLGLSQNKPIVAIERFLYDLEKRFR